MQTIHASVPANGFMEIFSGLSMITKSPDRLCQFGPVCNNGPGFPVCPQILPGIKTETTCIAYGTCWLPLVFGPVGLTCILYDKYPISPGNLHDRIHIGHLTE